MKILFIGDIVGNPGRKVAKEMISKIKEQNTIDFCIANGENSAGGSGITYVVANELYKSGIDVITLGNHTWSKKEVLNFIDEDKKIIRPANYDSDLPGIGSTIITNKKGLKIGVLNLIGRVYMDPAECPFRVAIREIKKMKEEVKVIFVDFHAEATSEKIALGWHLDGKVCAVVGTHTHVQTADERIFPFGTAFISDVGMTGPCDGVIGINKDISIDRFINHMPQRYELAKGRNQFNAILIEVDEVTGKTLKIERILKYI